MEQFITFAGNHPLLSAIWAVLVVLIIFTTIKMKLSPIKQLSPQELTFLVNRENGVVIDIRSEKDFKASHIVDAVHFANDKVNNNDFVSLEKYKDRPIIVVCAAGMTAGKASSALFKAGFANVNVLKGGLNAWLSAGLPLAKK
ncbi:rhodanese-like domain-containing protein [Thalassotalea agariperforans]|jgi:rhodanese-related sulfurtransferase